MQLPVVAKPKGLMTETEARLVGISAQRLQTLRHYRSSTSGSNSLSIRTSNGQASVTLSADETRAVLSLLIEREALFLSSMNIDLEEGTIA